MGSYCTKKEDISEANTVSWLHYSQEEDDIIKKYFKVDNKVKSATYIQTLLPGRTVRSILRRALDLGVSHTKAWSEEEDDIVKQFYNNTKAWQSCESIKNKYLPHRSVDAIRQRACALCLTKSRFIPWKDEELEIIHTYAETLPLTKIVLKLRKLWNKKGWQHRSAAAVGKKLTKLAYSRKFEGGYYSIEQLASALNCSRKFVRSLYEKYKSVLKPEVIGSFYVVQDKRLREFIMLYPGEIAKVKPDIIWLVGVLTPDNMLQSDKY